MSIEPSIADLAASSLVVAPDWARYRKCPICDAARGRPCTSMFEAVVEGRPAGGPKVLNIAHGFRQHRDGR